VYFIGGRNMRIYLRYDNKGKLKEYAEIIRTSNGRYGFKTRLHDPLFVKQYKLNLCMPVFDTEKEAKNWIENNSEWR